MEMDKKRTAGLRAANEASHRLTVEAIENALFILMKTKPYREIRVTEILKRSGASRAAFYNNFRNKDDIVDQLLERMTKYMIEIMHYNNSVEEKANLIYNVISSQREELKLLIDSGLDRRVLEETNRKTLKEDMKYNEKMYTILWNGAVYNLVRELTINDELNSLEKLSGFVKHLQKTIVLPEKIRTSS